MSTQTFPVTFPDELRARAVNLLNLPHSHSALDSEHPYRAVFEDMMEAADRLDHIENMTWLINLQAHRPYKR